MINIRKLELTAMSVVSQMVGALTKPLVGIPGTNLDKPVIQAGKISFLFHMAVTDPT